MSFLFAINGRALFPKPEVLLTKPFKQIWARDKSEDKEKALEQFAYMEFMTSKLRSNPFAGYQEDDRHGRIIKQTGMNPKYKPDKLVLEGIEFLLRILKEASPSYRYLMSSLKGADRVQDWLEELNPDARTDKGAYLLKPADFAKSMREVPESIKNLKLLEKRVDQELIEDLKIRGGVIISSFARIESYKDDEE